MRAELLILLVHQCSVLANTSEAYPSEGKFTRTAYIPWPEAVEVVFNMPAARTGGTQGFLLLPSAPLCFFSHYQGTLRSQVTHPLHCLTLGQGFTAQGRAALPYTMAHCCSAWRLALLTWITTRPCSSVLCLMFFTSLWQPVKLRFLEFQ